MGSNADPWGGSPRPRWQPEDTLARSALGQEGRRCPHSTGRGRWGKPTRQTPNPGLMARHSFWNRFVSAALEIREWGQVPSSWEDSELGLLWNLPQHLGCSGQISGAGWALGRAPGSSRRTRGRLGQRPAEVMSMGPVGWQVMGLSKRVPSLSVCCGPFFGVQPKRQLVPKQCHLGVHPRVA